MQITDSVADMLTRIRNAGRAGHKACQVPASNLKMAIAEILQEEGYIDNYKFEEDNKQGIITITLRYNGSQPVIMGMKRISKPGLRVYADAENLPRVQNGLGIAVISTSQGVMTDRSARRAGIGGEVLAYVW